MELMLNFVDMEIPMKNTNAAAAATMPNRFTHRKVSSTFLSFGRRFTDLSKCNADPMDAVSDDGKNNESDDEDGLTIEERSFTTTHPTPESASLALLSPSSSRRLSMVKESDRNREMRVR